MAIDERPPASAQGPPPRTARLENLSDYHRAIALAPVVSAAALGGLIVRIHRLDQVGLDDNEGYTVALAQRPIGEMAHLFKAEANGIAYDLLLWPLVHVSDAASVVRLPALVIGLLAIAATYWSGRELLGRSAALAGAALLAVSPLAVEWSALARADGLALLATTLSFGCLVRAAASNRWRWWALYVAALVVASYSNALVPLTVPVAQATLVLSSRPRRLRPWLVALTCTGVCLVPLALLLRIEQRDRNPLFAIGKPTGSSILWAARDFVIGEGSGTTPYRLLGYALLVIGVGLGACVLVRLRRLRPSASLRAVAAWAVVPTLLLIVISIVHPVWEGSKTSLSTLPAVCLLLGSAFTNLPRRLGAAALAAFLALLAVTAWLHPPVVPGYQAAGRWLSAKRSAEDPLVLGKINILPAFAYADPALRVNGRIPVEEWRDTPLPPHLTGFRVPGMRYGHVPVGGPSTADLKGLLASSGRMFFVLEAIPYDLDYVRRGAAFAWARNNCHVTTRWFNLTAIEITGCRSAT